MDLRVIFSSELKLKKYVGVVKTSSNRPPKGATKKVERKFEDIGSETEWSNQEQLEAGVKTQWRSEPVIVAKLSDDFWLGVKCQSNSDIADFLRKLFR